MDLDRPFSLLEDFGVNASPCGYCESGEKGSISHGMQAHSLTPEDYQELVDRGFRRSGRWLYRPEHNTCCPQWTIRLDATLFQPSKAQQRVWRRVQTLGKGDVSTASQRGAGSIFSRGSSPAADGVSQQRLPSVAEADMSTVMAAIDSAVQTGVAACQLPNGPYIWPKPSVPSAKQGKLLSGNVRLTSPAAMAITGQANRRQPKGSSRLNAASVSNLLAKHIRDGQLPRGWTVHAAGGYLNFEAMHADDGTAQVPAGGNVQSGISAMGVAAENSLASAGESRAMLPDPATRSPVVPLPLTFQLSSDSASVLPPVPAATSFQPVSAPGAEVYTAASGKPTQSRPCQIKVSAAAGMQAMQQLPASTAVAPGTDGVGEDATPRLTVRTAPKRRSQVALATDVASSPMASCWEGVDGASPMSVRGASPSAQSLQALLRTASQAGAGDLPPPSDLNASIAAARLGRANSPDGDQAPSGSVVGDSPMGASPGGSVISAGFWAGHFDGDGDAHLGPPDTEARPDVGTADTASSPQRNSKRKKLLPQPTSTGGPTLSVRLVPSTQQLVEEEFSLYKQYQVEQHGDNPDEVSMRSFVRFLVDSPLQSQLPADYSAEAAAADGSAPYGTYHMQYWLGPQLVAVSVVDVLPRCISSVYCFWSKRHAHLSLGRYTALREVEWAKAASVQRPELRYLYLGFWLAANKKMAYKADYQPSDLLCPETRCWVPLARVRAAISPHSYRCLAVLPGALDGLGSWHNVLPDGRPDPALTLVDESLVAGALLLLVRFTSSDQQLVRVSQLMQSSLLTEEEASALHARVAAVQQLLGIVVSKRMILAIALSSVVTSL